MFTDTQWDTVVNCLLLCYRDSESLEKLKTYSSPCAGCHKCFRKNGREYTEDGVEFYLGDLEWIGDNERKCTVISDTMGSNNGGHGLGEGTGWGLGHVRKKLSSASRQGGYVCRGGYSLSVHVSRHRPARGAAGTLVKAVRWDMEGQR